MSYEMLTCPFCKEQDFDAIGLKQHLLVGWCEAFNKVEPPASQCAPDSSISPGSERGR